MLNYEIYIVWSAAIYALVHALKALAKVNGFDRHAIYVRSLPLLPVLVGALSGAFIGPQFFDWSVAGGAFFGVGAAGMAATAHSVHRQTIRGRDARLSQEARDE